MLVGVHLDNVDSPPASSYRRIRLMRADVVLTLWTAGTRHRRPVYGALAGAGVHRLCIRVGDERVAGSVPDFLTDVDRAVNEATAAGFAEDGIDVQLFNEPNLGPNSAVVVGAVVGSVLRRWRRTARPLLPPVSRGKQGWQDYARAMLGLAGPLPKNAAYAVHAYAADAENLPPVDPNGVPIVVTEFSHPGLGGAARGRWVTERLRDLAGKGYGYAVQFICDGVTGGAWDGNYRMTDEEAAVIGQRGALPGPQEARVTDMVDISNNNGAGVDLDALGAAGIVLVGMKASQGATYADPTFAAYWRGCADRGIARLAYCFFNPDDPSLGSVGDPDETSGLFARRIEAAGGMEEGDLVALDCEAGSGDLLDPVCRTLELMEDRCGVLPGAYSARWWTRAHGVEHSDLSRYWKWWANYEATLGPLPVGWENVLIWQTGTGPVPGVDGVFDLDTLLVPLPDLQARGYHAGGDDVIQLNDADKAAYLALTGQAWSAAEGIAAILGKYGAEGQSAAEWVDQGIKAPVVLSKELTGTNR